MTEKRDDHDHYSGPGQEKCPGCDANLVRARYKDGKEILLNRATSYWGAIGLFDPEEGLELPLAGARSSHFEFNWAEHKCPTPKLSPPQGAPTITQLSEFLRDASKGLVFEGTEEAERKFIAMILRALADRVEGEEHLGGFKVSWELGTGLFEGSTSHRLQKPVEFIEIQLEKEKE